jgi:hypothetical protein
MPSSEAVRVGSEHGGWNRSAVRKERSDENFLAD